MTVASPFARFARGVCDCARLMVGVGDYEAYVAHVARTHPEQVPMDRPAFFRNRLNARYGRGEGFRCC